MNFLLAHLTVSVLAVGIAWVAVYFMPDPS